MKDIHACGHAADTCVCRDCYDTAEAGRDEARARLKEMKIECNRAVSAHERHQRSVPVLESALERLRARLAESERERWATLRALIMAALGVSIWDPTQHKVQRWVRTWLRAAGAAVPEEE